jgi:two-component system response regulator AtoC
VIDDITDLLSSEPRPLVLEVRTPAGRSEVRLPDAGEVLIGRSKSCTVRIDDKSISREHLRLRIGDELTIEDLGARNGTFVEGQPLPPGRTIELSLGDVVELGNVVIRVRRAPPALVARLLEQDVAPPASPAGTEWYVPASAAMRAILATVDQVAPSDVSVLLLGETGVGKEVCAEWIHARSPRAGRRFLRLHCTALPEALLESELFGHEKGAFTGAGAAKLGLLEAADHGTVFLDEIGELPAAVQVKLLRVLDRREVLRVGALEERHVDVRFIAATHRDLAAEVAAGRFREDLLFRIQEVRIDVPGLAARGAADVLLLAHTFLRQAEAQLGLAPHQLAPDATAALIAHAWPGNVRELKAALRRAAVLADGPVVRAAELQLRPGAASPPPLAAAIGDTTRPLDQARDEFVIRYVRAVLERVGGNREDAARELGIGVRTLYRYLE